MDRITLKSQTGLHISEKLTSHTLIATQNDTVKSLKQGHQKFRTVQQICLR